MIRRLVLVSLDWIRAKDPRMSLGHASLLARLAASGVDVVPVSRAVNDRDFSCEELLDAILSVARGGDVAIGVYVWNELVVQWILRELRRRGFTGRIILGGPQISYAEASLYQTYPDADVFLRGYAEDALAAVAASAEPVRLPGVINRDTVDDRAPAQVDLAHLPSPILTGLLPVQAFMRWETQRGCVFSCNFCQHREAGSRLRHRELNPGRIADEIDALVAGGARDIAVLDPIFNSNPDAISILQRFVDRGYTGWLSIQARFEQVNDAFLDACAALNTRLEFGLQTIHPAEMRAVSRMNNIAAAERVIQGLRERQVPFEISLIYGLPEQTLKSFAESVAWCQQRGAVVRAFPLMLLRGTGLDRDRKRWGLMESEDPIPVVVSSATFTPMDQSRMRQIAESLDLTFAQEAA